MVRLSRAPCRDHAIPFFSWDLRTDGICVVLHEAPRNPGQPRV